MWFKFSKCTYCLNLVVRGLMEMKISNDSIVYLNVSKKTEFIVSIHHIGQIFKIRNVFSIVFKEKSGNCFDQNWKKIFFSPFSSFYWSSDKDVKKDVISQYVYVYTYTYTHIHIYHILHILHIYTYCYEAKKFN